MTSKMRRGGMVGLGDWSPYQLRAWAEVENAEIIAVCEQNPDRLAERAREFNIPQTYTDLETMLTEADIDFVDICTRPMSHAALVKTAASHGFPVLCQKPFCTSLDEAKEVVAFCDYAGVRLMVNENFRWQFWFREIQKILDSGALGDVFLVHIAEHVRLFMPRFMIDRQEYLVDMPRLLVYELVVHYFDTLRFLFGEPDTIYARLHRISPNIKGEDVGVIILGYDGLTVEMTKSWASLPALPPDPSAEEEPHFEKDDIRIDGTMGTLSLQADRVLHLNTETDHQTWHFPGDAINVGWTAAIAAQQHFVDCLASGEPFDTSGAEILKTMAMVYGCYRSAEEGRVVSLSEYAL